MSLDEKIEKSKEIIREALEKYSSVALTWTGGKDSTLMLYLVKLVCEENGFRLPRVVFINEGDIFDEVLEFISDLSKKWSLDVTEIKNEDVLNQVNKVGDMVKVENLNETNRKELEKLGFRGEEFPFEPESLIGCHLMKTVPLKLFVKENSVDAVFVAIRWDEQEARSDETFFSLRKDPEHVRIHPILHFREKDVWDATIKLKIPINKLYEKGYRSLGARSTTERVGELPAWEQDLEKIPERSGRHQDKEGIMRRLRELGYM